MTDAEQRVIIQQGVDAWHQLKKSWEHWLMVGKALRIGREEAMHSAGTNRPEGKGYNKAFGEWLLENKLDDIDQGDRKRLLDVMDNLPEIEQWRATLTEGERRKYNHPSTVWRRWKKATKVPSADKDKPKRETQREANIKLDEENDSLKEHIKEIEASYEAEKARAARLEGEGCRTQRGACRNQGRVIRAGSD